MHQVWLHLSPALLGIHVEFCRLTRGLGDKACLPTSLALYKISAPTGLVPSHWNGQAGTMKAFHGYLPTMAPSKALEQKQISFSGPNHNSIWYSFCPFPLSLSPSLSKAISGSTQADLCIRIQNVWRMHSIKLCCG